MQIYSSLTRRPTWLQLYRFFDTSLKVHSHQTMRSADSAVNGCVAAQRQKHSYLCVDAVHCRICTCVNGPLVEPTLSHIHTLYSLTNSLLVFLNYSILIVPTISLSLSLFKLANPGIFFAYFRLFHNTKIQKIAKSVDSGLGTRTWGDRINIIKINKKRPGFGQFKNILRTRFRGLVAVRMHSVEQNLLPHIPVVKMVIIIFRKQPQNIISSQDNHHSKIHSQKLSFSRALKKSIHHSLLKIVAVSCVKLKQHL